MHRGSWLIALAFAALAVAGCGSDDSDQSDGEASGLGGAPDVLTTVGPSFDAQEGFSWHEDAQGTCQLEMEDTGCSGVAYEKEDLPLDLYVMFDRSGSMCRCVEPPLPEEGCDAAGCTETRLEAIARAFGEFLADPDSAGVSVGLGSFGQLPLGQTSCDPDAYATPDVPIAALPGNAAALMQHLEAAEPGGETPTGAAIRAACSAAQERRSEAPGHEVVILLLTDGEPKAPVSCPGGAGECCPTLADAASAAADCAAGPRGIRTYVLGVGPFLDNLGEIAAAGGSDHAYLVEGDAVADEVLAALRAIRGDARIPCQLGLPVPPAGAELDLSQVNMAFTTDACDGQVVYAVSSADRCGAAGGWHYDDPAAPTRVELCPASCEAVSETAAQLVFTVGCSTVFVPR
jgi:hypothetical protein